MLIASPTIHAVQVHFFGRSLLCPGSDDCPACYCHRPKTFWYVAATMNKMLELVEMCDSLGREIREKMYTFGQQSPRGFIVGAERRAKRAMWAIKEFAYQPELASVHSEAMMVDRFAKLYQLPFPQVRGDDVHAFANFLKDHRKAHVSLLARCVVPT